MQKSRKNNNPELLLPVGRTESYYAAVEGGADAIYLGLRELNARGRAANFLPWQVSAIIKDARKRGVSVHLTLNTVIKNQELVKLANIIHMITLLKPDAVIVQDWGAFHLLKKYAPKQVIHASTQMANHNSAGVNYSQKIGIERVVLARELTYNEISLIKQRTTAELELFVHGALCYSFSGMCLFSSYLGGSSANRGYCLQPCRRNYDQGKENKYFFNLKDNELLQNLPQLQKLHIDSLKIEGRLKPASYVHNVAKAYRMAIDNNKNIPEAKSLLEWDMGRNKTTYFYGGNVSEAIDFKANTGKSLGNVTQVKSGSVIFTSNAEIKNGFRLRFKDHHSDSQTTLKVKQFEELENNHFKLEVQEEGIKKGDEVFLSSEQVAFPSKIQGKGDRIPEKAPQKLISSVLKECRHKNQPEKTEIFVRIDSLAWLRKIRVESFTGIILNLEKKELEKLDVTVPFIQKNIQRFHIELPKFISEESLHWYKKTCSILYKKGIQSFFISHLSQKEIVPQYAKISTNENVYVYNDAAAKLLRSEGIFRHTYPLENDLFNLTKGTDRWGILPIYFYPHLFYSRMPVSIDTDEEFVDKKGVKFRKIIKNGITIVIPVVPVSFTQYYGHLISKGFNRFLIDLSHTPPSKNSWQTILKRLKNSEQIQPSTNFNFKRDLK